MVERHIIIHRCTYGSVWLHMVGIYGGRKNIACVNFFTITAGISLICHLWQRSRVGARLGKQRSRLQLFLGPPVYSAHVFSSLPSRPSLLTRLID